MIFLRDSCIGYVAEIIRRMVSVGEYYNEDSKKIEHPANQICINAIVFGYFENEFSRA